MMLQTWLFRLALLVLVALRMALVADLSPALVYAPHDDLLYVKRAFHLLSEGDFGPYNSQVLVKYPGISLWLAATRSFGLPYLATLNLLYAAAGLYLLAAMQRCGVRPFLLLVVFILYLFNPVTMGAEWIRVLREPLATVLLASTIAAMLHLFVLARRKETGIAHLALLAALFAFAMLVREEERLLWVLLGLFAAALWFDRRYAAATQRLAAWQLLAIVLVPAIAAVAANAAARHAIERWYGLPILYDLGEGEYPRLVAAIRGIVSKKDNRLVMVTQEALVKLRAEVPEFVPVLDRLSPPGPGTLSCRLQGVCSEWSNGWMLFWIKDAAAEAGLTPNLPAAQAYFKSIRDKIVAACQSGRLQCHDRGSGLVPPFELKWTRAYIRALFHLARMVLAPSPSAQPRQPFAPELERAYYYVVTMAGTRDVLRNVDLDDGQTPQYRNPLASWRPIIATPFQLLGAILLVLAVLGLLYRCVHARIAPLGPLAWIATTFYAFTALRLAALAYLATFFGPFDSRILFASHVIALAFAPLMIDEAARTYKARRRALHTQRHG